MEQENILKHYYSKGLKKCFLNSYLICLSFLVCMKIDSSRAKREICSKQAVFTKLSYNKHCHHTFDELQQ